MNKLVLKFDQRNKYLTFFDKRQIIITIALALILHNKDYNNMSDQNSPKTSSQGSAPEFIKGVEKLIESDEDDSIAQRMIQLQKNFPILKKMHFFLNNAEKISLFLRDHNFRNRLSSKLKEQGILNAHPIVKVKLYSIRYRSEFYDEFEGHDLWQSFSRFGKVQNLYCDKKFAYVEFIDYISAYIAIKTLNDFPLDGETLRLSVQWAEEVDEAQVAEKLFMAQPHNDISYIPNDYMASSNQNKPKLMCRYDIYLDEYPDFKVGKKLIGPQGSFMKRIIEGSVANRGLDLSNVDQLIKLRLRGKGSGYKEGPNAIQSEERLHLCVSSREQDVYIAVCLQIEKLLWKVAEDYKIYTQKFVKKPLEGTVYNKIEIKKGGNELTKKVTLEQIDSTFELFDKNTGKKISESEILQIISKREQARKYQLRNYLKKRGVLLIDEKGCKGKEKRTKWKFIDD